MRARFGAASVLVVAWTACAREPPPPSHPPAPVIAGAAVPMPSAEDTSVAPPSADAAALDADAPIDAAPPIDAALATDAALPIDAEPAADAAPPTWADLHAAVERPAGPCCTPGGRNMCTPCMREGRFAVSGRLPDEVVRRIVRQHFGQFRLCYEDGLRRNDAIHGSVFVRFVINRRGEVAYADGVGSTMPDPRVVQCVVSGFNTLSFPEPEGGIVRVVYPIYFQPE
jgi:hypothetical protein